MRLAIVQSRFNSFSVTDRRHDSGRPLFLTPGINGAMPRTMNPLRRAVLYGFTAFAAFSAMAAPPADEVLAKAKADAAAGHKSIFLLFDASW